MKTILWILGGLIVVLIIAVTVIGLFYIGPIIKVGMEQVGPRVAQVSVKVDGVDVSVLSGSASIKGLVVGNPQGYTTPQAISVGTMAVSLDPMSVTTNKILIHSIHVVSPQITFEGGISNNNLSKILDNVKGFIPPPGNNPPPKIEVDDFLITGAQVHVNITGVVSRDLSLPDIHLTDLGRDSNGLTPAELSSAVLKAVSSDTLSAVTGTINELGQGVKSLGQNTVKTVGENVSKVLSTNLNGLFGK